MQDENVMPEDENVMPEYKNVMPEEEKMMINQRELFALLNATTLLSRDAFFNSNLDVNKKVNSSCGYPDVITRENYKELYEREGIATRIINLFPEECWSEFPSLYETDDAKDETDFEKAWSVFMGQWNPWTYLSRVDELSGIGRFGVILIGLNDGKKLYEPVENINENEQFVIPAKPNREVIYLRPFDESFVKVSESETDETNPRFGQPKFYEISFSDTGNENQNAVTTKKVHWSRVVHFADNRKSDEHYGTPRLQACYNRMLDLRKLLGSAPEMFWKGGFQGLAITGKGDASTPLDYESIKAQIKKYQADLQRYLAMDMVDVNTLSQSIADPTNLFDVIIRAVCITLGCPKRIFEGSERGELSSSQDLKAWNRRITKRNNTYLTPFVIKPFVNRLVEIGVLPKPEKIAVEWPALDVMTEKEQVEVAKGWADALKSYALGEGDDVIGLENFLKLVGFDQEQIRLIKEELGMIDGDNMHSHDDEEEDQDEDE